MEISEDTNLLAYGDELGFINLFSIESMSLLTAIRSMGYEILDISLDMSYSLVISYNNVIAIYDKTGQSVRVYNLDEDKGKVIKMVRKQNMLMACTEHAHFYLIDLMDDKILGSFDSENEVFGDQNVLKVNFDDDLFKGVCGNSKGEISVLEIL